MCVCEIRSGYAAGFSSQTGESAFAWKAGAEGGPVAAEEAEEEVRAPAAKVLLQVLLYAGCRC